MAPRRTGWSARPALVLAVIGLLVALVGAALVAGGLPERPSVVPPSPEGPSPSASDEPTSAPVPTETASPTPRSLSIEIIDSNGVTKSVTVEDRSGLLEQALPWEADPDRPQNDVIEVSQLPADEGGGMDGLIVQWVDLSCADDMVLVVDETARELVLETETCEGDAMGGIDHGIWLDFSEDVPATEVTAELVRR